MASPVAVVRSRAEVHRLVEENLGIARAVASRSRGEFDELFSVASLGLLKAAETHDPALGTFASFAFVCARRAVARHARRYRSIVATPANAPERGTDVPLDAPIGEEGDATRLDALADDDPLPAERIEGAERDDAVRVAVDTLPERERAAVRELYFSGDEATLEQAGASMGIGREGAAGRERSALRILARRLSAWE